MGSPNEVDNSPATADHLSAIAPVSGATQEYLSPGDDTEGSPPAPKVVGAYEIGEEIARGGMGVVLRGRDRKLNRELAFKVLLCAPGQRPDLVRRFLGEARITGQLQHPGVVPIHQVGELADGRPFFAMKLVQGKTLAGLLAERRNAPSSSRLAANDATHREIPNLPPETQAAEFLPIFEQVCQTVAFAHSRGVVHRDLKPSNVMVGAFGEVQVMDWGLAKSLGQGAASEEASADAVRDAFDTDRSTVSRTQAGVVLGTAPYMAPEQARGDIDRHDTRTDVFALGAILCELLTGAPPYQGTRAAIFEQAVAGQVESAFLRLDASEADAALIDIAKRCLAPDPAQRPRDAGQIAAAITSYQTAMRQRLHEAEIAQARIQTETLAARKRRRLVLAFASVLALLCASVGGWQTWLAYERGERSAKLTRDAGAAMARAGELWETAKKTDADDLVPWAAALGAAETAWTSAELPDVAEHVRAAALEQFEQIKRDKNVAEERARQLALDGRVARELDNVPAKVQRFHTPEGWDYPRVTAAFQEVFLDGYGIDIDQPDDAVRRVNASAIRKELLTGLEWWLPVRPGKAECLALADLVQRIDPDPTKREWRLALAQNDRHQVRLIARKNRVNLSRADRVNLAKTLALGILFEDVVDVLKPLHVERPDDYPVNLLLAQAYHRMEPADYAAAERHGWMAIAARPGDSAAWTHVHATLLVQRKFESANEVLLAALANTSDDALLAELLRLHQSLSAPSIGKADVAFASAEKAVALRPEVARAHYALALMWLVKKQPDIAYKITRDFLDRSEFGHDARMVHGSICWRTGRIGEGSAVLRSALEQDPDQFFHKHLGMRLTLQPEELQRLCDDYLARKPNRLAVLTIKGWCCEFQQRWDQAEGAYRHAISLAPRDKPSRQRLARVLAASGKHQEALDAVGLWIASESPAPPGAYMLRADILERMGKPDDAIAELRRECDLDPTNESARFRIIDLYLDHHRPEEGLKELLEAVKTPPMQARKWGSLGRARRHLGDYEGALEAFRKALHYGGPHWLDRRFIEVHIDLTHAMVKLAPDLRDILAGSKKPVSAQDAVTLGKMLHLQRRFAASNMLYLQALALKPSLMDDRDLQLGYEAACSAALAVTPLSKDRPVDEGTRAALRKDALAWMRAELAYYEKLAKGNYRDRTRVINVLTRWKTDADLAPIRGHALESLPQLECVDFERFWSDVNAIIAKAH